MAKIHVETFDDFRRKYGESTFELIVWHCVENAADGKLTESSRAMLREALADLKTVLGA